MLPQRRSLVGRLDRRTARHLPAWPQRQSRCRRRTNLPKRCKGAVKACAARSTCGKPGFVNCCRTTAKGTTKCSTKSSAALCKPAKHGLACVGQRPSCCDACVSGGCAVPSAAARGPQVGGVLIERSHLRRRTQNRRKWQSAFYFRRSPTFAGVSPDCVIVA